MSDTIVEQIRQLNTTRGVTVLLVEHNLKVVSALCPLVLAMDAGKIVAQGTVQSLASSESFAEAYLANAHRKRRRNRSDTKDERLHPHRPAGREPVRRLPQRSRRPTT